MRSTEVTDLHLAFFVVPSAEDRLVVPSGDRIQQADAFTRCGRSTVSCIRETSCGVAYPIRILFPYNSKNGATA